jgi:hypothetical protein
MEPATSDEGRSPAVSGLTFTHREADEKKFPALCRRVVDSASCLANCSGLVCSHERHCGN